MMREFNIYMNLAAINFADNRLKDARRMCIEARDVARNAHRCFARDIVEMDEWRCRLSWATACLAFVSQEIATVELGLEIIDEMMSEVVR